MNEPFPTALSFLDLPFIHRNGWDSSWKIVSQSHLRFHLNFKWRHQSLWDRRPSVLFKDGGLHNVQWRKMLCFSNNQTDLRPLCVAVCCKEIYWSYLESMSQRCVCLVPKFVEDDATDELFNGLLSPVLIRINSSSDITVSIDLLFY